MKKKIDWYGIVRVIASILIALIIATIIIFAASEDPVDALNKFLIAPFKTKRNFFNIITTMIPLVFCGLSINVMHKSGLFSMVAVSSFYLAGVTAATVAIAFPMPNIIHQIVIIVLAGAVGGVVGLIPVWIKKHTGANELVVSLMLNYISFNLGYWIIRNFFIDSSNDSFSVKFEPTASLGKMVQGTTMHYGFLIMIATVVVVWLIMDKSRYGRSLKLTGANENFAKYAGIKVGGIVLSSQFLGGLVAGIGGGVEMIGSYTKFQWITAQSYVWDGVLINLLANTKPLLIPVAAFLISYIRVGANIMSRSTDVDNEIVSIIQAIIILLIASERFMYGMKKRKEEREALQNQSLETKSAN